MGNNGNGEVLLRRPGSMVVLEKGLKSESPLLSILKHFSDFQKAWESFGAFWNVPKSQER